MGINKILIVDDIEAVREISIFFFETIGRFEFLEASSGEEALKILKQHPDISLTFCDFNMSPGNGQFVLTEMRKFTDSPYVLFSTENFKDHPEMLKYKNIYHVEKPLHIEKFTEIIKNALNPYELEGSHEDTTDQINDYLPVHLSLLSTIETVNCPLYISLGENKLVKTHHAGTSFDDHLINKYLNQKVSVLYIKKIDFYLFTNNFDKFMTQNLGKESSALLQTIVSHSLDMTKSIQDDIGLTPEIEKITAQNIDLVLKLCDSDDSLKIISSQLKKAEGSLYSQHCILTAIISTSIGKKLNWVSDQTSIKWAFASIIHDSILPLSLWKKIELENAHDNSSEKLNNLSPAESKLFHNHSTMAAELSRKWKTCPVDVETIILQHHELPDGHGFPGKLNAQRINPMSAIFIVAHHLATDLILKHGELNLQVWLQEHKNLYQTGDFKKAFGAINSGEKAT